MALVVNVAGACRLDIAAMTSDNSLASGGAWNQLGYGIDGVTITENQLEEPVYGDQNGGPLGTPVDIQKFGEIHRIEAMLTKWDPVVSKMVEAAVAAGTPGVISTVGGLMLAGQLGLQLWLNAPNFQRQYLFVTFNEPKTINFGTKHSQYRITGTAYPVPVSGGLSKIYLSPSVGTTTTAGP